MALTFRPFNPKTEYPAFVELHNSMYTDSPTTVEETRSFDERFAADILSNGVDVRGGVMRSAFWVIRSRLGKNNVRLELYLPPGDSTPTLQKQLYSAALNAAKNHSPNAIDTRVREDWTAWRNFLEAEGYEELERQWESRLDITSFDPALFEGAFAKAEAAGIRFGTLAELPDNENTQRKLYELITGHLLPSVPFAEPLDIWDFDTWQKRSWRNPQKLPEAYFLAWDADTIVGMSELYGDPDPKKLSTGLTAVLNTHRRQGIAMSLKLKGIAFAKNYGATEISTFNHSNNRPMLAINEALGFAKDPAWITLRKVMT